MSDTKCQQCGVEFYSKPSTRRKFCSLACSSKGLAAVQRTRVCLMCGTTFVGVGRRADNIYCSRTCSDKRDKVKSLRGVERVPHLVRTCVVCGVDVRRRKSDIRTNVFCSRECYGKARSMHLTGTEGFEVTIAGRTYWANMNTKGYVLVYAPELRTNIAAHRLVMEQTLGRKLGKGENVHHKNGKRDDNRPSNLELWITSQPSGQRVDDVLRWAEYIVKIYTPLKKKHLLNFGKG